MGDNQTNGPLDLDQASERMESLISPKADNREPRRRAAEADLEGEDHAEDPEEVEGDEPDPEDGEDGEQGPDEDEDEEQQAAKPGQTYTVKIDGEEIRVTERELLDGYQRQADYTKKSMALAEQRKANEAELQAVRSERQQMAHWAQQMIIKLQREAPEEPDWDTLRATDPVGYSTAWVEHQRYREQQAQVAQQYEHIMRRNQQEEARALQQTLATEGERLVAALPEWKDAKRAEKEKSELMAYGREQGFTDEELNAVYDSRTVLVLRKAWLYDRIQKARPQAAKGAAPPAPPPAANGPGPGPRFRNRAVERLAKTGSIKDAAAAFEKFF